MRLRGILLLAALCAGASPQAMAQTEIAPGIVETTYARDGLALQVITVDAALNAIYVLSAESPSSLSHGAALEHCEATTDAAERESCLAAALGSYVGKRGDASLFVRDYAALSGSQVVLSGGYMESFAPPRALGLVMIDGEIINRQHRSWLTTAVFCQDDDGRSVLDDIESVDVAGYDRCLQAGPLVVDEGRSRYDRAEDLAAGERKLVRSVQEHAFVCIGADGAIRLGVSEPMDLTSFAAALAGDVGCLRAMRLSGHETAGMVVGETLHGRSDYPMHNVFAVFARDTTAPVEISP